MKNKKSIYIITLILLVGIFVAVQNFMSKNPTLQQSTAAVHFIDVGQGDSILISSDNYNVLIDGGDNNQGETVVNYIKSQNINHLDAIIVSHPHADHIGGLDTVIKELSVEKIFMKKLPRSQTPTTKSYLDFLNAIKDKGLKITEIKSGAGFTMGNGYLTFVNSDKDFDDLNNQSAVVKFEYNSQSFLFTGDIEKQAEKAILKSDISADVLKVAHHGSNTSTT
ncbi:MAG: MBL fold metallo-hydrolase, partial [Oscillospiraceae bacterium]